MLKKIFLFLFFILVVVALIDAQTVDTLRGQLHEIEIITKYNPAIPLIKKTIQNRNENGQFSNKNFSCLSYQKMIFTGNLEGDTALMNKAAAFANILETDTAALSKKDSSYLQTIDFFEKYHLYFMETVTKNYYKKPSTTYEKVIAHRTAGMKDPIVSIFLAKQQALNFYYSDFVNIFETSYTNPISKGSLSIYDFRLLEKIVQENDTLFVISFQPQKNAHFKSLTGKVWITSENYAITKIEAAPFDKALEFEFIVKQIFEKQPNHTYFLTEMFFRVDFPKVGVSVANGGAFVRPVILTEKKISAIDYETHLRNHDFGLVDIDEDLETDEVQEKILNAYRPESLTDKELSTITFVDSIAAPYKVDKRLESLKILITGKIPLSVLNFDITQILYINSLEILRLGIGVYTNERLSKVVNFGGFLGYGFKDRKLKWGGELGFTFVRTREFKATFQYYSNLIESGRTDFFDRDYTLFSGEFYRTWLFKQFYRSNALGVTVQSKLTRWLSGYVSSFYSANKTIYDYNFQHPFEDGMTHPYFFDDFFVKVGARIAFRESFWGAEKYYFHSVSRYPVLVLQFTRGIKGVIHSGFNYNRVDLKMTFRKDWKILGFTNITLFAGFVDRALPHPLLLNQRAGYNAIGIYGADHFGTMRADEFLSDKYATLFLSHNFGRMTQNKKFSPRIVLCQGIGFGGLSSLNSHEGIDFKTMEKGYFESGIMINDLLILRKILSFGVGAFVRYGAYYLPKPQYKTIDNFAFKASIRVPFGR
jgi:hypothetical protein